MVLTSFPSFAACFSSLLRRKNILALFLEPETEVSEEQRVISLDLHGKIFLAPKELRLLFFWKKHLSFKKFCRRSSLASFAGKRDNFDRNPLFDAKRTTSEEEVVVDLVLLVLPAKEEEFPIKRPLEFSGKRDSSPKETFSDEDDDDDFDSSSNEEYKRRSSDASNEESSSEDNDDFLSSLLF